MIIPFPATSFPRFIPRQDETGSVGGQARAKEQEEEGKKLKPALSHSPDNQTYIRTIHDGQTQT